MQHIFLVKQIITYGDHYRRAYNLKAFTTKEKAEKYLFEKKLKASAIETFNAIYEIEPVQIED